MRTPSEDEALRREAERRVRAGEPRAEVARSLGIPNSTMSQWAFEGQWRAKDLRQQLDHERGEAMKARIAGMLAAERARQDEMMARLKEQTEAGKKLREQAASGDLPGEPQSPRKFALSLANLYLREGRVAEADKAIQVAQRLHAIEKAAVETDRARWRDDRDQVTAWWRKNEAVFDRWEEGVASMYEEMQRIRTREDERQGRDCCPACDRPMDFWPVTTPEDVEELEDLEALEALEADIRAGRVEDCRWRPEAEREAMERERLELRKVQGQA